MSDNLTPGQRIEAAMAKQGIGPSELARRVEVTYVAVRRWVTGARRPAKRKACLVAKVLNLEEADLR